MASLLALLSLSLLLSSSVASGTVTADLPPPPETAAAAHAPGPFLLAPILSNLGFQEMALAVSALYSPVLAAWSGPLTLFAPSDDSLRSCPACSPLRLLREHLVPGLLPTAHLRRLPSPSKLQTASPARCLTLTSTAGVLNSSGDGNASVGAKIFVDGVEVTRPDLFNDGRFVIHGIQGFVAPLSPLSCPPADYPAASSLPPEASEAAAGAADRGSAVVRLMLRDAIVRLRDGGFSILALAMRVKYAELASLRNMTIFALDDPSIFAGGHAYVTDVRFHVVPDRLLTGADLHRLPAGTLLPTLVRGQHLVVTHTGSGAGGSSLAVPLGSVGSGLRINYVPIKAADVVFNSRIAVHSVFLPFPHLYLADLATAVAVEGGVGGFTASGKRPCGAPTSMGECSTAGPAPAPAAPVVVDLMDDGL